MAHARDWATGFREQASADLNGARILQGNEPSVLAMLLQMVLEKLAKAALLRTGQLDVPAATRTHRAASTLLEQLGRNQRMCARLGLAATTVRHRLAPLVDRLERAHPSLAGDGPCLEYPWVAPGGEIQWPAAHLEVARRFGARSNEGQLLFDLLERLQSRFDQAFP